jgi:tetratricopeptide (TPR) repeat protein
MFLGASITAMFATLVFTFSRAGWAGFLFALVVMSGLGMAIMFRTRRSQDKAGGRPKAVLPVVILAVVIIAVAAVSLTVSSRVASAPTKSALERALSSFNLESGGVADRVYLWRSAIAMIKDRPVLGWGPETFGTYFPKYRTAEFAHYELNVLMRPKILFQNRPHSDILQAGTSAGVSGIAAYLALLIAYFWFAIRRLMGIDNLADTALLVGIIGGLAGYFAQIQFSFSTIAVSPIVWLLMALTFVIGENRNDGASLDKIPHPVLIASLVILEIVVLVGIFLSARPLVADYYFDQAVSALEKSDSYTAGLEFDRAMALNPYEPEYPNFAGNMFVEVAKASQDADTATTALTTAIDYLEKGIALNPDMPGYHYNMANVKYYYSMIPGLDKGLAEITMKEALGEYLFAIEADPNNPDVHLNLASAYMRFDRKAQAIAEIRKALKLSPNNVAAKSALMKLEEEK